MANLRKEIEIDKKWNEKKVGPCMNVSLSFDSWSVSSKTMTSKKIKRIYKEIETWKVANRLWNGKIIKKRPMLKANSVLRA